MRILKLRIRVKISDLYRGIDDFKRGYQFRTNIVNYETGDLVTGFSSI